MKRQLAYCEIALEHGGHTVFLRPSLRAAMHLERLHGGFPELLRKLEEFDTFTVWHVITAGAGKAATDALFGYVATQPLSGFFNAAYTALFEFYKTLTLQTAETDRQPLNNADPRPWADLFKDLYCWATGCLHWSPETAWNATPQEIADAFEIHMKMLMAIHGTPEEDHDGPTEEQRQENIQNNLDPEFDRAGLDSLRALSTFREGQMI
ncbi:hypothetical protein HW561_04760 [Rhodobacteraceae bacterium B1Z28]|uniref:Tail assembly chaperone n=1 Tax=Ruegeria haliotis TaxID=2747601 RepID=A0ABX2PNV3_9RHOB|nr:hypothetical protein [Ruegeria haliotis]NVO55101.1 hypothetical protein [Ruegeria haliotis]